MGLVAVAGKWSVKNVFLELSQYLNLYMLD